MARCVSCNRRIGFFARRFTGYSREALCKPCALLAQRRRFADQLAYKVKEVNAYPKHVEPLRDLDVETRFAELLLQSDAPLGARRSKEMKELQASSKKTSSSDLMFKRSDILTAAGKLIDQLRQI
jgi:hypothetical protein